MTKFKGRGGNNLSTALITIFIIVSIWIGAITGYILNIISIAKSTGIPLTGMFILRIIGIFVPPIGCVIGYF